MPRMSASWKASVPIIDGAHLAGDRDHRHGVHVGVGQRGDQVGRARAARWPCRRRPGRSRRRTPGRRARRPARAGPGCAGSCVESNSGSYAGRMAPPGMPKMFSAPACSRDLIRLCAPVIVPGGVLLAHLSRSCSCWRWHRRVPRSAQQKTPRPRRATRGDAWAGSAGCSQLTRRVRTRMSVRMDPTVAVGDDSRQASVTLVPAYEIWVPPCEVGAGDKRTSDDFLPTREYVGRMDRLGSPGRRCVVRRPARSHGRGSARSLNW